MKVNTTFNWVMPVMFGILVANLVNDSRDHAQVIRALSAIENSIHVAQTVSAGQAPLAPPTTYAGLVSFTSVERARPSANTISIASVSAETVWVTTYHHKYIGRKTRSGETYYANKLTCAVPRSKWKSLRGKTLRFTNNARVVDCRVTDSCGWINGREVKNYDLSRKAWTTLFVSAPSRKRATMEVVK